MMQPDTADSVFDDVEVETYRELQLAPDVDIGPEHVVLRCPKTGELFGVARDAVAPPGVLLTPSEPPPAPGGAEH